MRFAQQNNDAHRGEVVVVLSGDYPLPPVRDRINLSDTIYAVRLRLHRQGDVGVGKSRGSMIGHEIFTFRLYLQ
jgi:hypothetical protein